MPTSEPTIYIPQKTVLLPICGHVDVSEWQPIIADPQFRPQSERKQLGLLHWIYPSATGTRLEHVIGSLHKVRGMIRHFRISVEDPVLAKALEALTLLHDIGHGPLSHEIEPVLGRDHHEIGLARIASMRHAIEQCGVDYDLLCRLYRKEHPWSKIVGDVNFGADKMDYLDRDAYHLGHELGLNLKSIIQHLQFQDGILGVDEECTDDMIHYQHCYLSMYTRFYYCKTGKILARMLQRAIMETTDGGIDSQSIWDMTDTQLMGFLADHPLIRRIARTGPFETLASFKIVSFEADEHQGFNSVRVYGLSESEMHAWSHALESPAELLRCEQLIESELGLPNDSVVIAQPILYDKIVPPDVPLYRVHSKSFDWLYRHNALHFHFIQQMAQRAFAIRIAMEPGHFAKAERFDFLGFFRRTLPLAH